MTRSNPEALKLREYAAFDVLRFLLASTVMLFHEGVLSWNQSGSLAVQVFFALSGWLIGGILFKSTASELSRFYFNRSTRIWIPYFAGVAALYLTSLVHEPVRSVRWPEFLVYDVTFTHNWFSLWPDALLALSQMPLHGTGNHFWSLAVEEQFYLVAPIIMTCLPFGKRVLPWVFIALVACASAGSYGAISLGVLAAILGAKYPDAHLTGGATTLLLLCLVLSGIAMSFQSAYAYSAPVFAITLVLLCARPLRRNAVTRWMGGVSFQFYLNFWIGTFVFNAVIKHFNLATHWYFTAITYLAGLGAGAVLYHLIDVPVMARRDQYYSPKTGWILGAIGYLLVAAGVSFWLISGRFHAAP